MIGLNYVNKARLHICLRGLTLYARLNTLLHVTLGDRILARRKLLGLSQAALGKRCGTDKNAVSRWERSTVEPSLKSLRKIALALGVTTTWLMSDAVDAADGGGKSRCG